MISNIIKEFLKCRKLKHNSIIKVYEVYIDEDSSKVYIIMELTDAKELFSFIYRIGGFSEY